MIGPRTRRATGWMGVVLAPAHWLERAKGRRRLALAAIYATIVLLVGVLAWRESRLSGLPDVGDPFEPAPLLALTMPEERNAFTYYNQAAAKMKKSPTIEGRLLKQPYTWPASLAPEERAFLDDNAEALALWRQGCEQPDALLRPIAALSFEDSIPIAQEHRRLTRLALLEASRHVALGDMEGAWDWYRAVLRGSRLVGRHGFAVALLVGMSGYQMAMPRIGAWAVDPRTDPRLIRRALDEVVAINRMTGPLSEGLKIEYLTLMRAMSDPDHLLRLFLEYDSIEGGADRTVWYNHLPGRWTVTWFVEHEPERARRMVRLTFANWLAHCDEPPATRPPMVGTAKVPGRLFDAVPAGTPAGALSPSALARRIDETPLVEWALLSFPNLHLGIDRDRAQRATLVLSLANELYARDHGGEPPESPEALVGPYLDRLPDGAGIPDASRATTAR